MKTMNTTDANDNNNGNSRSNSNSNQEFPIFRPWPETPAVHDWELRPSGYDEKCCQ